jgi:hypothetical protein
MRRAEQLSKVADPFAEPIRGGVMEVEMIEALLWFIAVFLFFGVVAFIVFS